MLIQKNNLAKWILLLADAYGKEITKDRAAIYCELLGEQLMGMDFKQSLKKIVAESEFFPSVHQILASLKPAQPNPRQLAENFVDKVLHHFAYKSGTDYCGLTRQEYYDAKTIGISPPDVLSGAITARYDRTRLIDRAETFFQHGPNMDATALPEKQAINLLQEIERRKSK